MSGPSKRTLQTFSALAVFLSLFAGGCGSDEFDSVLGNKPDEKPEQTDTPTLGESVDVEIQMKNYDALGFSLSQAPFAPSFSLAIATRVVVNVIGCASGYSVTGHDTAVSGTSLKVYTGDRGCVAQLTEFTLEGQNYTPVSGLPFSGSSSANFRNASGTVTLEVYQFFNLSDPIIGTDRVSFGLRDIQMGSNNQVMIVQNLAGYPGGLPATDPLRYPPNLRFFGFPVITGLTNQGGNREQTPIFTITLECAVPVVTVGADLACPSSGYNQLLRNTWYRWREASATALTYGSYTSVYNDIRKSSGNPRGEILPGTTQVVVGQVLPASTGFNGGIEITGLTYIAPGGNNYSNRHFALIFTTSNITSQTAYGHSALAFSLTK